MDGMLVHCKAACPYTFSLYTHEPLGECLYQETTSDSWDITRYTTRKYRITILYHAIENTVANTICDALAAHDGKLDVIRNISNTRDSVSSGYLNSQKRAQRSMFDEIGGVWIADETLSRVFDISFQSKQKLRVNGEVKPSKSTLIKRKNLLQDCDFLCFNLMNY